MKLTKQIIQLSSTLETPFLLVDLEQVKKNYKRLKKELNGIEVFYSLKANAHPRIVETLVEENAPFDVTSQQELNLLAKYKLPPEKIICLNPIKSPDFLKKLHKQNITVLAYDSFEEVDKIAQYALKSKLILRIVVDNEGSDWPLTKKYGVDPADAIPLLKYAKDKGLDPVGLTFHVGSQCRNKNNWVNALFVCETIWKLAKNEGIELSFLSLGGGLPIQHNKPIPALEEISKGIHETLNRNFTTKNLPLRITIEPGRAIIGDAAIMVTSVIGKAKRGNENWIYIDAGVFNAFMETIDGFTYEILTEKKGINHKYTIGGPSCDSVDIPFKNVLLHDIQVGSKLYVLNAGAYTTVYGSNFNGFAVPRTYFLNKDASKIL